MGLTSNQLRDIQDALGWINLGLLSILFVRVVRLNRKGVFRLFLLVLLVDFAFLGLTKQMKIEGSWARYHLDYRIVFSISEALELAITAFIIFALLRSFMDKFPGILKLSHRLLWGIVAGAVSVGLILAVVQLNGFADSSVQADSRETLKQKADEGKEFENAHVTPPSPAKEDRLNHLVTLTETFDQTISTVLVLILISMLLFLLWFPIDVPRNAVVFSAGYIIFFAVKSLSLFLRNFSIDAVLPISVSIQVMTAICCLYWLFFLTVAGEKETVRPGHGWKPRDHERLLDQLGAINATLIRSARRSQG